MGTVAGWQLARRKSTSVEMYSPKRAAPRMESGTDNSNQLVFNLFIVTL